MPSLRHSRRTTDGVVCLRIPVDLVGGAASPLEALDLWTAATALTPAELDEARRLAGVEPWLRAGAEAGDGRP